MNRRRSRLVLSDAGDRGASASPGAGRDLGIPQPPSPPEFKPGAELSYRPLSGGAQCRATVRTARPDGTIDLNVYSPGCSTPIALSKIVVHRGPAACPPGRCQER